MMGKVTTNLRGDSRDKGYFRNGLAGSSTQLPLNKVSTRNMVSLKQA
jgi:hypothetical protein